MRVRPVRALAASIALAFVGASLVGLGAAPAQASTVTVPFRCVTTVFGIGYDVLQNVPVTITAPTAVDRGNPLVVTYNLATPPSNVPVALGNAVLNAAPTISAQNHTGGPTVLATGTGANSAPTNVAAFATLPVPMPVTISIATATFTVGDHVDLTPAVLRVNIVSGDDGIGGGQMTCTPEPSAPVAAQTFINGTLVSNPIDQCTAQTGNTTGGAGCDTNQNAYAAVLAGNLTQQASTTAPNPNDTTVDLGSTTSSTSAQVLSAPMNQITVTDTRGGSFQWSLTASLTTFADVSTHTIAASQAKITPSCAIAASGSAAGATAGAANQSFAGAVSLCTGPSVPDLASGSTGGQWNVNGPISLTVPAFQAAGTYVAILTINLA